MSVVVVVMGAEGVVEEEMGVQMLQGHLKKC